MPQGAELDERRARHFLANLLESGVDSVVARIELAGKVVLEVAAGENVRVGSWFDLASLTKPFIGTLALRLHDAGLLRLDQRIGDIVPGLATPLAKRTLEDLLRHRSGLEPWLPFYQWVDRTHTPLRLVLDSSRLRQDGACYSDLGFLLWGWLAEEGLGCPLAELLSKWVIEPLGCGNDLAAYPGSRPEVLPCRLDNGVEVRLAADLEAKVATESAVRVGVPQDGNARYLSNPGELTGHCGLFGNARAMAVLGGSWLADEFLPLELRKPALESGTRYALGWWRPTPEATKAEAPSSAAGRESIEAPLSHSAFGMVGFTGGSCWIDQERRLVAVLLAHRSRSTVDMRPWRRRFHQMAVEVSARPA